MNNREENGQSAERADLRHFTIKTAGLTIAIETLSPGTYGYCIRYLSEGSPDICVSITEEDIQREIQDSKNRSEVINNQYLETIAVYRKIAEKALCFDTILMHGSVIAVDGRAYMFSAPSGTGKTTHIRKWLEKDSTAFVVNGDKPLIRITDTEAIACGTPWCGKERMGTNTMVPLRGIAFMERSEDNSIEEISFKQAIPFLIQQIHCPKDSNLMMQTLSLLDKLKGKVRFFRFRCNNFKEDCFRVSHDGLCG